jgi:acyl-CoA synthetase (AMP-forming)/AMP-acid ligase II
VTRLSLLHQLLDVAARDHPDRPAIRLGAEAMSYGSMRERSERLAAWLAANGVRRGDRVLIALPADVLLPALLYACSRIGGVFVVLRERTPAPAAAHVVEDAGPVLVLSESGELREMAARRGVAIRGLDDVRAGSTRPAARLPDGPLAVDPACFIYTSGSTAMPKAVVSTHQQVTFAACAIHSRLQYRLDDVVYCPLPLSFDYGLYQIFLCTLAGAELRLAPVEGAGHRLLVELRDAGTTVLPAVPALADSLARLLSRPGASLPRLRLLTSTGAAMPESVLTALREFLPRLQVQLMYGLTECKRATIMPADEDRCRQGACGRALPGTEVFVVSPDGVRLPAGEVGEVVVRGPNVMAGYWRRPALTAERFRRVDGLFPELRTGDYGRLDADGYLYLAGRRDDLYKERGFRVSTIEVEAAARRVPGVLAAAVVPPAAGEEGATLFVESGLPPHEVLHQMRRQIDDVKVPARCIVVSELPLNANGKIERRRLAGLAGEGSRA